MRAIWKGAISFGLVNIPITLYPATRREEVRFHFLRKSDLSPINNKRVAEIDGKEVPWDEIVKGFQYEKGKFVVLQDDDFSRVDVEATQTVDIQEFVELADINPMFFSKPYYMEPGKGGDKSYALLREILKETGKVGIAKVVIKTREHLAAVKAQRGALVLELMHFADEIISDSELHLPGDTTPGKKELEMARQLLNSMTGKWDPDSFKDDYREALMEVIQEKIAAGGKEIDGKKKVAPVKATNVIDLVSVLQKSLQQHGQSRAKKAAPPARDKARRKRLSEGADPLESGGGEHALAAVEIPGFVEPMKAKAAPALPPGDDWIYELKLDGFRFLASKGGSEVRLFSRLKNDLTARFPAVAAAIAALPCETALIDGELVVADEKGRPSFQLIQRAETSTPVQAFAFDLLLLDGVELRHRPLHERRAQLATLLPPNSATLHLSAELAGDPRAILGEVARLGLEGLIAKQRSSFYEPGRRSGAWLKIKCLREQEFVIGGFTAPKGSREAFGALVVGHFRGDELVFAGRVGTGFDDRLLRELKVRLTALQTPGCPFVDLPRPNSGRGQPFTRAEMTKCVWVRPELVCQVRFAEWTDDGILRQPAFIGMREDKAARDVVRET